MYPRQNVPSNVSLTQDTGRFFDLVDNPVPDLRYGMRTLFQTRAAVVKWGRVALYSAQLVIFSRAANRQALTSFGSEHGVKSNNSVRA